MQIFNNEAAKTVATLPLLNLTKADEAVWKRDKVWKDTAKETEDRRLRDNVLTELTKLEWYDREVKRLDGLSDHIKEATFVQRHGKWWLFEKVRN